MRTQCAWCQTDDVCIKENEAPIEWIDEMSHGICDDCAEWLVRNHNQNLREFLNSFDFPVMAIEYGGRIKLANEASKKLLGKPLGEIEG